LHRVSGVKELLSRVIEIARFSSPERENSSALKIQYSLPGRILTNMQKKLNVLRIRLEARLQPNIGLTFERALTVFTRSGITSPKVKQFGRNMEHSE